jgi:hypothetical protein
MRAAVVPMAPLLFRSESGLADPVAELREVAVQTVRDLADGLERIVALCPVGFVGSPDDYHLPSGAGGSGPLSVQVARHLLELADVHVPVEVVPVQAELSRRFDHAGLLVLGDGTARRSQTAPGFIDERSFPIDDLVADALEDGDGDVLSHLDQHLAEELMMTGRHTFAALGNAMPRADAELRYRDDPFGMTYFVALWR